MAINRHRCTNCHRVNYYCVGGTVGSVFRNVLGVPTRAAGNAIKSAIQGAIDSAIQSAQNKVKETTDEIKAIPSNVQKAAVEIKNPFSDVFINKILCLFFSKFMHR